jgi:hypothetical protein
MIKVTFKNEGVLDDGTAFGPCHVIDMDAAAKDPKAQGFGIPYGYKPAWDDDKGWVTLPEAEAIATGHDVLLEKS